MPFKNPSLLATRIFLQKFGSKLDCLFSFALTKKCSEFSHVEKLGFFILNVFHHLVREPEYLLFYQEFYQVVVQLIRMFSRKLLIFRLSRLLIRFIHKIRFLSSKILRFCAFLGNTS